MKDVYIVSARRTATGGFLGSLSGFTATQLGALVIRDAHQSVLEDSKNIDAVFLGHVLSANTRQSPARQAALLGGLSEMADCTTVNKVCASGLKALTIGAQQIQLGSANLVMTGGMESMSNVPHYLFCRTTHKMGDQVLVDGLLMDGLTDAYSHLHMGNAAELCARNYHISRQQQDEYALQSYERAQNATKVGKFEREIVPVKLSEKNNSTLFNTDEDIYKVIPEKVPLLPPAFEQDGTVTAANASNLNDGAAAILLASAVSVKQNELSPLAKIVSFADAAQSPDKFTTSPSLAMYKALQMAQLTINEIDFFEINEAYASVVIAHQHIMGLSLAKVNVYGGAVAMGHPLGASGARILCTLISVLKQEGGRFGMAAICNGGGGATAIIIENLMK